MIKEISAILELREKVQYTHSLISKLVNKIHCSRLKSDCFKMTATTEFQSSIFQRFFRIEVKQKRNALETFNQGRTIKEKKSYISNFLYIFFNFKNSKKIKWLPF